LIDATSDEAGAPLLDEDYLILSTIHSAKGQEWTSVFLLNTVDGCIPSDLATGSTPEIEEERRLLYVDDVERVLPDIDADDGRWVRAVDQIRLSTRFRCHRVDRPPLSSPRKQLGPM
jgi:hypothetical protein